MNCGQISLGVVVKGYAVGNRRFGTRLKLALEIIAKALAPGKTVLSATSFTATESMSEITATLSEVMNGGGHSRGRQVCTQLWRLRVYGVQFRAGIDRTSAQEFRQVVCEGETHQSEALSLCRFTKPGSNASNWGRKFDR